jgi:hypothetical protein
MGVGCNPHSPIFLRHSLILSRSSLTPDTVTHKNALTQEGHDMRTLSIAMVGLVGAIAAGTASAIELRDAELVASGSPVLQNGTGTVRLEDSRLGRPGLSSILVPEPGALWQQGAAIGLLVLLKGRRRHHTCSDTSRRSTRSSDPATPSRRRIL